MEKKNYVKGTLVLGLGGIIAKFLGFFFRIPLIYMIGEEGIGLYQLTYPLYSFLLAIAAGVPTALSKMISERTALGKSKEVHKIFKITLFLLGIFGGISSVLILVFSKDIIRIFDWNKGAYYSLLGISLAPLFTCLLSAFKGYFQGIQSMFAPAASQVIEQITRITIGVGLAYIFLYKGIAISAGGASFGAAAGSIIGLTWMMSRYRKNKLLYNEKQSTKSTVRLLGEILKIAVPISIGQAIGSIMALIDSMMVPGILKSTGYSEQLATALYGQLTGKAFVLVNVPLTLSIALAQSTVPTISESYAVNDKNRLKRNIRTSFKMAMILALPCAGGLYALASPILSLVFGGAGEGFELMQILAIASIFIIIAQTSTSILNGIGKTIMPVIAMIFGCFIKIIISMLFIPLPQFNIKAAAYGTLCAYGVVAIIDFILVIKYTKVYINIHETFILPLVCSVVMVFCAMLIYTYTYNIILKNGIATLCAIAGAGIVYFIMLMLTKTFTFKEMKAIIKR